MAAQAEHMMCIHKQELTALDVYHRILRYKNYMVAMVNKSLLPLRYSVPLLGDHAFLSTGLRFNLELLLFKSPWVSVGGQVKMYKMNTSNIFPQSEFFGNTSKFSF